MKFLTVTSLATGAFASALIQRDLATIKTVMAGIGNDLVSLDTAVKDFSGGDPTQVLTTSNTLIQDLKDGKAKVDPTAELSLTDALGLQAPAKDLQTKGDALLADFKAKRDVLAAAGLCGPALQQATSINAASQDLIKAVVSKVPAAAQSIAQGIVAPLLKDLQDAQDAFSPDNCKDGGSPPVTSNGPAPPTTTAATPTTTAPPTTGGSAPPTTTVAPPGTDTCPAVSTVTVTATDTNDCTATPTCTQKSPVTITTTKKACPTGSKLPW